MKCKIKYNVKMIESELIINKKLISNTLKEMENELNKDKWDKMIDLNDKLKKQIELQNRILNIELYVDLDYLIGE